jgi:hypothetical protein
MTRRLIAVLVSVALTGWLLPAGASPLPYEWRHSVGISLADVATDDMGFTVVTGQRQGYEYGAFMVAAFDGAGTKLWQDSWRPIRGEPAGTMGKAIAIGPDGNVYALGFGWHCRFGCESGGWFIRAYARDGTLRWTRQAAGWKTRPRQSEATGIDTWSDGLVITGYEYDDYAGATVSWLRAYGLDGTFAWKTPVRVASGTEVRVATEDVAVAPSGAIFVAGYISIGPVTAPGLNDLEPFIAGFTAVGEHRWTRVVREHGDRDGDRAVALDVRGATLVVAGELWHRAQGDRRSSPRGWLSRLSLEGDVRWTTIWGGGRMPEVADVALTPDGRIATIGSTSTGPFAVALALRTFSKTGQPEGRQELDPARGGLRGSGVAIDAFGASLVGTHELKGSPGNGRLWRLG